MSEVHGTDYESFVSLAEAQAASDAFVVLEGDDGGQIFAAFPAASVQCSEDTLLLLLRDLDAIAWPGSYEDSVRVVYERRTAGSGISGGMGGGRATPEGWIHSDFEGAGLAERIREVIAGRRDRIDSADPR